MQITELIVIRHGETQWNTQGRVQGHLDSPLTDLGLQQANALARRMTKIPFTVLYSSDLGRAFTTASCIAEKTGHSVLPDLRLRERNLGLFEGLTLEQINGKYPEDYRRMKSHEPDFVIPEGESIRQAFDRVTTCFTDIAVSHPGERVVVVTHGGVLDDLMRFTLEIPLEKMRKFRLFNAGVNVFLYRDGSFILNTWGDISHLEKSSSLELLK